MVTVTGTTLYIRHGAMEQVGSYNKTIGLGCVYVQYRTYDEFGACVCALFSGTPNSKPSRLPNPEKQEDLRIEGHWRVNGTHYARTSEAWLKQMDQNKDEIMPILGQIYGEVRVLCSMFHRDFGNVFMFAHRLFE